MPTINNYQVTVGFMAPTTGQMIIPANTEDEAKIKAVNFINQQYSNATVIQCVHLNTEEIPEEVPVAPVDNQSVVLNFPKKS